MTSELNMSLEEDLRQVLLRNGTSKKEVSVLLKNLKSYQSVLLKFKKMLLKNTNKSKIKETRNYLRENCKSIEEVLKQLKNPQNSKLSQLTKEMNEINNLYKTWRHSNKIKSRRSKTLAEPVPKPEPKSSKLSENSESSSSDESADWTGIDREYTELKDLVCEYQETISNLQTHIFELNEQLETYSFKVEKKASQLSQMQKNNEELRQVIQEMNSTLAEKDQLLTETKTESEQLEATLQETKKNYSELDEEYQKLKCEHTKLQLELEEAKNNPKPKFEIDTQNTSEVYFSPLSTPKMNFLVVEDSPKPTASEKYSISNEFYFKRSIRYKQAILYSDDTIEIGTRIQTSTQKAVMDMYIGNKSNQNLSSLETYIEYSPENLSITIDKNTGPETISPGSKALRKFFIREDDLFEGEPILKLSFNDTELYLKLPVCTPLFFYQDEDSSIQKLESQCSKQKVFISGSSKINLNFFRNFEKIKTDSGKILFAQSVFGLVVIYIEFHQLASILEVSSQNPQLTRIILNLILTVIH